MNNFLRNFVMKTLIEMINKNIAEWQVRQYALGWYTKQIITEEDLAIIEQKYTKTEETENTEEVQDTENNVENAENVESVDNVDNAVESEEENGTN